MNKPEQDQSKPKTVPTRVPVVVNDLNRRTAVVNKPAGTTRSESTKTSPPAPEAAVVASKRSWRSLVHSKKAWLAGVIIVVLVAGGALVWVYRPKPVKSVAVARPATKKPEPAKPVTVADPLTGIQVSPDIASQPIAGVMIENLDPDARPQSGLGQAGAVYEALAEGGITRFLAIFQEPFPAIIGPVRSLRPYYLDWGLEYQIPVAHAGGSQPALAAIKPLGLKNIEALIYDGSSFYRTKDRYAPHNLYTNDQLLAGLLAKLGFASTPNFSPLPRKADAPAASPSHPIVTINYSYSGYTAQYRYDVATNSYARFMGGVAHIDRNTGKQIMVKNVVVEYVPTSYGTQDDGAPETILQLIGQGKSLVFTDGNLTEGTWSKSSDASPTKLLDASGQPIKLNAGNTWYGVVPVGNVVSY